MSSSLNANNPRRGVLDQKLVAVKSHLRRRDLQVGLAAVATAGAVSIFGVPGTAPAATPPSVTAIVKIGHDGKVTEGAETNMIAKVVNQGSKPVANLILSIRPTGGAQPLGRYSVFDAKSLGRETGPDSWSLGSIPPKGEAVWVSLITPVKVTGDKVENVKFSVFASDGTGPETRVGELQMQVDKAPDRSLFHKLFG